MSSLPPYSTYRTDSKQMPYPQQLSHGNVLSFTPPGFKQQLHVKFPDSRLAVCEKCKRNYKTRDMCRVRNNHTAPPWTMAYMCVTLDDNCTDENGKFVDKPFAIRMIQWQPFCVKKPFDPKTPVCSACKKTNRTRSFCRERHKHRQLPWCTVYVLLSPADTIDPATRVAPESTPVTDEEAEENAKKASTGAGEASDPGDDINDISESRTFLCKVSCNHSSVHWLEIADFDATDTASLHGAMQAPDMRPAMPMDPSQYPYPPPYGGFSAQQHQLSLKSHQQYFFQMQQRQHQHYAAQQAAWQASYNQQGGPPPGAPPGPGQATSPTAQGAPPVTAGEAAAQQSKMAGSEPPPGAAQQNQSQWMAYHQQMYQNQMVQFQQSGGVVSPPGTAGPPVDFPQGQDDEIDPSSVPRGGDEEDDDETGESGAKRTRYV